MKVFVYTRERTGLDEWYFTLTGKTPRERRASLNAAETAYQRRFRQAMPAPNRITRIGRTILLSYPVTGQGVPLIEGKATPEIVAPVQLTLEVL